MKNFSIYLQSGTKTEEITDIISFTGTDESGSFGILADHARIMTCLKYGLAQFKRANGTIEYLVMPGAIVYFVANKLFITTRLYYRNMEYGEITKILLNQLAKEDQATVEVKTILKKLDESLMRKLWQMKKAHTM
jgi:F-type H+-transporting ATPase subunit epsilon